MDCERCTGDLTAYLDGELTETKSREVKSHLEACESCQLEYRSLDLSARFVETHLSELQLPYETWNRIRARVTVMEAPTGVRGLFHFLASNPWWSAAGTAVATALLVLGLWGYLRHMQAQRDLMRYMTQYVHEREADDPSRQTTPTGSETAFTDATPAHSDSLDNPFATVNFTTDVNPFRSEDQ